MSFWLVAYKLGFFAGFQEDLTTSDLAWILVLKICVDILPENTGHERLKFPALWTLKIILCQICKRWSYHFLNCWGRVCLLKVRKVKTISCVGSPQFVVNLKILKFNARRQLMTRAYRCINLTMELSMCNTHTQFQFIKSPLKKAIITCFTVTLLDWNGNSPVSRFRGLKF